METYSENNDQCHNIVGEQNGKLKTASITCDSAEGKKSITCDSAEANKFTKSVFCKIQTKAKKAKHKG